MNDYYCKRLTEPEPALLYPHYKHQIASITAEECERLYKAILNVKTEYHDTHPSFQDRVKAINAEKILPAVSAVCAYHSWFKDEFIRQCEDAWKEQHRISWSQYYKKRKSYSEKMQDLAEKETLSQTESEELLRCVRYTKGYAESIKLAEKIYSEDPYNYIANLFLGSHKAIYGDRSAIDMLMFAVNRDFKLFGKIRWTIFYIYEYFGEKSEYDDFSKKYNVLYERYEHYHVYTEYITSEVADYFGTIDSEIIKEIKHIFSDTYLVTKAYLSKKTEIQDYKDVYFVLYRLAKSSSGNKHNKEYDKINQKLYCIGEEHGVKLIVADESVIYDKKFVGKIKKRGIRLK